MKSKLTLSLPEKTIAEAKQIAKQRQTTVSALFAASLHHWQFETKLEPGSLSNWQEDMSDMLGLFTPQSPFDARSTRLREKHG